MPFHSFRSCSFFLYRTGSEPMGMDRRTKLSETPHVIIRTASLLMQDVGSSFLRTAFLLAVFCILHANIFLAIILQTLPSGNLVNTQGKILSMYIFWIFSSVAKLTETGLYTSLLSCWCKDHNKAVTANDEIHNGSRKRAGPHAWNSLFLVYTVFLRGAGNKRKVEHTCSNESVPETLEFL